MAPTQQQQQKSTLPASHYRVDAGGRTLPKDLWFVNNQHKINSTIKKEDDLLLRLQFSGVSLSQ